jgi:hypothetical protein
MPSLEIKDPVLTIDRLGGDIVFDAQRLQELLNDTTIPSIGKRAIQKINKNKKNHNTYVDKYDYKEGEIGRVYSEFQQLPKEYRNYLLGDDCIEIDFENCHYVLISQIADKYNVKNDDINCYIQNREECLKSIHTDRNCAKQIYLKAQYGGKIEEVCNDNINGIVEEIKNIITMLNADEKLTPIKKYAKKQLNKKNNTWKSLDNSFLSYVLQTIENRNVIALFDYLKQNEVEIKLINHDGIIIKKNDFDYEKFKGDMEKHIFDETDFSSVIGFKPCEQKYTNNAMPIKCGEGQRRFVNLLSSSKMKGNNEYFDKLVAIMGDMNKLASIYKYFMGLQNIPVRLTEKDIVKSDFHQEMESIVVDEVKEFIMDYINENKNEVCDKVRIADLYPEYKTFCGKKYYNNVKSLMSFSAKFGILVRSQLLSKITKNKKDMYGVSFNIPTREMALDFGYFGEGGGSV